jgi:hypothetical protein
MGGVAPASARIAEAGDANRPEAAVGEIGQVGVERAAKAVEHSTAQGWTGIFEQEVTNGSGTGTGGNLGQSSRVAAPNGKYSGIGKKSGLVRLRLNPQPTVRHQPAKDRSVAEIGPTLRQVIRQLVAGETRWPLFLHGPVGTGKTCAALCLLDHAGGVYLTAAELADQVIDAQQGRLEHAWEDGSFQKFAPAALWKYLAERPLVVIDELGARDKVSDPHYEAVKRLLDLREGRPLIALSNLDLEALAQRYDDRIASRLAAGTVCQLDGEDRRLER